MFTYPVAIASALLLPVCVGGADSPADPARTDRLASNPVDRVDRYGDPLPPGAIMRLGTARHRFEVIGILPDGETVVSAGRRGPGWPVEPSCSIQLWHAGTGRLTRVIESGIIGPIAGACLSRDGRRLAIVGSDHAVRILDLASGKEIRTLSGLGRVNGTALTPDGTKLIILDAEGKLSLREVASGLEVLLHGFLPGTRQLQLSADGSTVALRGPPKLERETHAVPDGRRQLITVRDRPGVIVWNWQKAEEPREFDVDHANESDKPDTSHRSTRHDIGGPNPLDPEIALAISSDGSLFATCDAEEPMANELVTGGRNYSVSVCDARSGRKLHKLLFKPVINSEWLLHSAWKQYAQKHYRPVGMAFSEDGKTLAASFQNINGFDHGALCFWDVSSGKFLRRLDLVPHWAISTLAFAPNGKLVACGRQVWDLKTGRELLESESHQGQIWHTVAGPNDLAATAGTDDTVRIWNVATGKQLQRFGHQDRIESVAISPDGAKLVSSSTDDSVCLWDLVTGNKIYKLAGHGPMGPNRAVTFTADRKSILSWGGRDPFSGDYTMVLREWDVQTGKAIAERPTLRGLSAVFSTDSKQLVLQTNPYGNMFVVFDTASGKELESFSVPYFKELLRPSDSLVTLAISPDSKLLLVCTGGGTIASRPPMRQTLWLWDWRSGKSCMQIQLPENGAEIRAAFSGDGKLFAAASSQPREHIWVWRTSGQMHWETLGFSGTVLSLAFMPDGRRLLTGMEDSSVIVWDISQKP
jgi:WD40 repeat protein